MILEILKFIFGGFWRFIGAVIILDIICDAIVKIFRAIFNYKRKNSGNVYCDDEFFDED